MNPNEFITLTNPIRDKVFRLAKRMLESHEESEDALQEVMLKLWAMRDRLTAYKSIEALSMTVTKNYCLDHLRSRKSPYFTIVYDDFAHQTPVYQKDNDGEDKMKFVGRIVATQLSEKQKLVLQMRDVEQYELGTIAEILEMTEVTVRVTLARARNIIKENMIKSYHYGEA
ncbi:MULTISPECIES: sigma-70 family RNA polymerase sigma factor [unclassified Flavobacterium]|uniref:RNA polymerase sigma factor n=1 Tax=unclassified Flavobacterium TaxID=196869 RepID=UPI0025C3B4B0|nr:MULTISPECIES: sigma-70 family RNA polymerase sigma factor [unclassified Flavobacterium]